MQSSLDCLLQCLVMEASWSCLQELPQVTITIKLNIVTEMKTKWFHHQCTQNNLVLILEFWTRILDILVFFSSYCHTVIDIFCRKILPIQFYVISLPSTDRCYNTVIIINEGYPVFLFFLLISRRVTEIQVSFCQQ